MVQAFIKEHKSEDCNYPLSRRFFKKHLDKAFALLDFGLNYYSTELELLGVEKGGHRDTYKYNA